MIDSLEKILDRMFLNSFDQAAFANKLGPSGTAPPENVPEVNFGKIDPQPPSPRLNVNLVDLRENRKLRSNERVAVGRRQSRVTTQKPASLDCHFLATSWVKPSDPEKDVALEHSMLYFAASALLRNNPLVARSIFRLDDVNDKEPGANGFENLTENHKHFIRSIDPILRDRELPVDPLPPEGYPKIAEFCGLLGIPDPVWRPCVYFVVTIPIEQRRRVDGPLVRSISSTLVNRSASRISPNSEKLLADREVFCSIAGRLTTTAGTKVKDAPIELRLQLPPTDEGSPREVSQKTLTDTAGEFFFSLLSEYALSGDSQWEIRAGHDSIEGKGPLVPHVKYDIRTTNTA